VTEQGYPPRQPDHAGRSGRSRTPQEPRRTGWQMLDAFEPVAEPEADVPPWAGPTGIEPIRPARRTLLPPLEETAAEPASTDEPDQDGPPRGGRSLRTRSAAGRRRRSRRRLLYAGVGVVVIAVIAGAVYYFGRPGPRPGSDIVTTLQSGEYRQVPNACRVLPAAVLSQFLSGTPKSIQPYNQRDQSQCTYTVDIKPTFRLLNLTVQAYQPYPGLIPGNGSATANAMYNFSQQRQQLAKPPKHTPQPPATIVPISGLGNQALSAVQIFHTGSVTDRVTVLIRYHNVLITAYLEGEVSGGFGPAPISSLQAGALGAARAMLTRAKAAPATGS
jgi:hypothetical protein